MTAITIPNKTASGKVFASKRVFVSDSFDANNPATWTGVVIDPAGELTGVPGITGYDAGELRFKLSTSGELMIGDENGDYITFTAGELLLNLISGQMVINAVQGVLINGGADITFDATYPEVSSIFFSQAGENKMEMSMVGSSILGIRPTGGVSPSLWLGESGNMFYQINMVAGNAASISTPVLFIQNPDDVTKGVLALGSVILSDTGDGVFRINGSPVTDGTDGDSAYQIALNGGFVGTEAEWITSLEGAQGPQGIQGEMGAQGIQGADGAQGDKGDTGSTGAQGLKGDAGSQGPQGIQGPQGLPGQDGSNATAFWYLRSNSDGVTAIGNGQIVSFRNGSNISVYRSGNDIYIANAYSYTHPSAKQCSYSYSHPSTKQCSYSYAHPSTQQCVHDHPTYNALGSISPKASNAYACGTYSNYWVYSYANSVRYKSATAFEVFDDLKLVDAMAPTRNPDGSIATDEQGYGVTDPRTTAHCITNLHELPAIIKKQYGVDLALWEIDNIREGLSPAVTGVETGPDGAEAEVLIDAEKIESMIFHDAGKSNQLSFGAIRQMNKELTEDVLEQMNSMIEYLVAENKSLKQRVAALENQGET